MATTRRRRPPQQTAFTAGPWKEVVTTNDPIDDTPNTLVDATNLYIPDPAGMSGAYARPGMTLQNLGDPVWTQVARFSGQGTITHTTLAAETYNFCVFAGHLFRVENNFTVFTDVTPLGITIDPAITTRVYGTSLADQLVITDGVNRPWLATNLSATPITGTAIDYDSVGGAWSAFGPFVVYGGSMFCILNTVGGIGKRTDIAWSLPGDVASGWQQTNYDFNWTLEQSGSSPLFALAGTNTQLYYWRESAIGSISGTPGPNLSGQSTHDALSQNVGTITPQTVIQYGENTIFFTDAFGRPYRLTTGGLDALWLKMRAIVDVSSTNFPGVNKTVATACFDPTLNRYLVAPWSPTPSQSAPAVEAYAFDARTGIYHGRFVIADGVQLDTLGTFVDANGRGVLVVLGSAVPPGAAAPAVSGYCWSLNALSGQADYVVTESPVALYFATEDGIPVTTEGTSVSWTDNGTVPTISATTTRFGYELNEVLSVDRVSGLVGTTAPCQVSATTAALALTLEATPTPSTVQDSVSRFTCGFNGVQGRGVSITVQPTTADTQWSLQQIGVTAVRNRSNPDEV